MIFLHIRIIGGKTCIDEPQLRMKCLLFLQRIHGKQNNNTNVFSDSEEEESESKKLPPITSLEEAEIKQGKYR